MFCLPHEEALHGWGLTEEELCLQKYPLMALFHYCFKCFLVGLFQQLFFWKKQRTFIFAQCSMPVLHCGYDMRNNSVGDNKREFCYQTGDTCLFELWMKQRAYHSIPTQGLLFTKVWQISEKHDRTLTAHLHYQNLLCQLLIWTFQRNSQYGFNTSWA